MNRELINKILHSPGLYSPNESERPMIDELIKEGYVLYVKEYMAYTVTLKGILFLKGR